MLNAHEKPRWGYVCDAGTWGVEEAEVVCKQLGFSRGVQKTTQGLVHGKVTEISYLNYMSERQGGGGPSSHRESGLFWEREHT